MPSSRMRQLRNPAGEGRDRVIEIVCPFGYGMCVESDCDCFAFDDTVCSNCGLKYPKYKGYCDWCGESHAEESNPGPAAY